MPLLIIINLCTLFVALCILSAVNRSPIPCTASPIESTPAPATNSRDIGNGGGGGGGRIELENEREKNKQDLQEERERASKLESTVVDLETKLKMLREEVETSMKDSVQVAPMDGGSSEQGLEGSREDLLADYKTQLEQSKTVLEMTQSQLESLQPVKTELATRDQELQKSNAALEVAHEELEKQKAEITTMKADFEAKLTTTPVEGNSDNGNGGGKAVEKVEEELEASRLVSERHVKENNELSDQLKQEEQKRREAEALIEELKAEHKLEKEELHNKANIEDESKGKESVPPPEGLQMHRSNAMSSAEIQKLRDSIEVEITEAAAAAHAKVTARLMEKNEKIKKENADLKSQLSQLDITSPDAKIIDKSSTKEVLADQVSSLEEERENLKTKIREYQKEVHQLQLLQANK